MTLSQSELANAAAILTAGMLGQRGDASAEEISAVVRTFGKVLAELQEQHGAEPDGLDPALRKGRMKMFE